MTSAIAVTSIIGTYLVRLFGGHLYLHIDHTNGAAHVTADNYPTDPMVYQRDPVSAKWFDYRSGQAIECTVGAAKELQAQYAQAWEHNVLPTFKLVAVHRKHLPSGNVIVCRAYHTGWYAYDLEQGWQPPTMMERTSRASFMKDMRQLPSQRHPDTIEWDNATAAMQSAGELNEYLWYEQAKMGIMSRTGQPSELTLNVYGSNGVYADVTINFNQGDVSYTLYTDGQMTVHTHNRAVLLSTLFTWFGFEPF